MHFLKLLPISFIFFLYSCANIGYPEGGPKDETPPKILKETPPNNSTKFDESTIEVLFDEYILMNDIKNTFISSPPLKNFPEIKPSSLARKKMTITIKDTLKPNTTYIFNFGNSIKDFNENNKLPLYKYIFSTGLFIDSLKITSQVEDAFSLKTDKNIYLCLYEIDSSYNDSTIYKEKPDYISNFLDSNTTTITNIKDGKYILLALKDENNNLIYDLKSDKIGFVDYDITLPEEDTNKVHKIKLFKGIPEFNYLKGRNTSRGVIEFVAEGNNETFKVEKIYPNIETDTAIDFLTYTDSFDTIKFNFNYDVDSIGFYIYSENEIIDTLNVGIRYDVNKDPFKLQCKQMGKLEIYEKLTFETNFPIKTINKEDIKIIDKDSNLVDYKIILDSLDFRKFILDFEVNPEQKYYTEIYPHTVKSIFNDSIPDTLKVSLNTLPLDKYGNLKLSLDFAEEEDTHLIVDLLDQRSENIIRRKILNDNLKEVEFKNLNPSSYSIRVIKDTNKNGRWDTGDFLQKRQPEKVKYYQSIEIKEFWDVTQPLDINWDEK